MTFENFKSEILRRAENVNACKEQFERAIKSESFGKLVNVITDNFHYCCNNGIIDSKLIEPMNAVLLQFGLCANVKEVTNCFCIATDNSSVWAYDNSSVWATDNSSVRATGNSSVWATGNSSVWATGNSSVRAYGNSSVWATDNNSVRAFDNSSVRAFDNSSVRATDNSSVRAFGNSSVWAYGNSSVRALDNSYICSFNTIEHKISERAICRYYHENKIAVSITTKIEPYE